MTRYWVTPCCGEGGDTFAAASEALDDFASNLADYSIENGNEVYESMPLIPESVDEAQEWLGELLRRVEARNGHAAECVNCGDATWSLKHDDLTD